MSTVIDLAKYAGQRRNPQSKVSKRRAITLASKTTHIVNADTFDSILAKLERYKEDHHGNTEKQERLLSGLQKKT